MSSATTKKLVGWSSIPVALVGSAALVWHASYSAFTATTSNPTNNWAAGSVALSDDDSNTAMFTASNLKPGSTGVKCIAVTSSGSLPSAVKLYGTSYAQTKGLGANINLSIEEGTGGSSTSCAGFTPLVTGGTIYSGTVDNFATTKTGYNSGVSSWAPTGTAAESRSFRVTYTLSNSTPDSAQGGTAALGFTWEAQNT